MQCCSDAESSEASLSPTIEVLAQERANVLKLAVGSATDHNTRGSIQGCKVTFEGNVAGLHRNPSAQALKSTAASVVAAQRTSTLTQSSTADSDRLLSAH